MLAVYIKKKEVYIQKKEKRRFFLYKKIQYFSKPSTNNPPSNMAYSLQHTKEKQKSNVLVSKSHYL